jgi:hypothetical protein
VYQADEAQENDAVEYQEWLSTQPEDVRDSALEGVLADAKLALGDEEVAAAGAMGDDEAERALAREIAAMKARDHREYVRLLASLSSNERAMMRDVERRYGSNLASTLDQWSDAGAD